MCTGCMMCLKDRKPEYFKRQDYNEYTAEEAIEWFSSPWECLLAIIKHCELFADDNEEFVRVEKVIEGDEVLIYWDAGVEFYPKDDVEEWTSSDFANYLSLYDGEAFISVMEKEKIESRKEN